METLYYVYYDDTDGNPNRTEVPVNKPLADEIVTELRSQGYVNVEALTVKESEALGSEQE